MWRHACTPTHPIAASAVAWRTGATCRSWSLEQQQRRQGQRAAPLALLAVAVAVRRLPASSASHRSFFHFTSLRRAEANQDQTATTTTTGHSDEPQSAAAAPPSGPPSAPPSPPPDAATAAAEEEETFPPPRPSPTAPRRLSVAMAKRILAPHLYPLADQSPWQTAKADLLQQSAEAGESATGGNGGGGGGGGVSSAASKARAASVPMRRPYAFLHRLTHHWLLRLSSLLQYGLSSEGNSVSVYFDGDDAFEAMFAAIGAAHERVCLETFMWKPDRIGLRMISELEAAAARGCQVLVLYDSAGSFSLRSAHFEKLAAHPNAHIVAFNPMLSVLFRTTRKDFSHRTHRKILIADAVAFAGGMNTSEQYAGPRLGINEFRDTHARITGPAVEHLAEVFYQSLQEAHAHDKATWKRIFASIRTRTTARLTESSLFQTTLDWLADSGTTAGERAGKFFEATRDRQRRRLEQLQSDEAAEVEALAEKGKAAAAASAAAQSARFASSRNLLLDDQAPLPGGAADPVEAAPASAASTPLPTIAHTHTHTPPGARESLDQLRRFMGSRLRQLAQSSASANQYRHFEQAARLAERQWRAAWKRVRRAAKTARVVGTADPAKLAESGTTDSPSATQQPLEGQRLPTLPSSALSALTASLTPSSIPAPKLAPSATAAVTAVPIGAAAASSASGEDATASTAVTATGDSGTFDNVFLQILPSNTIRGQYAIQHALMDVLDAAHDYILITNPFLVPPVGIKNALLAAGARGTLVRLIVGGKSDTPFMRWSSTHLYHHFLAHPSIHIYEYQPRILHAKTVTCDGLLSTIGSFNLDFLSSHKLLEVNIGMLSAPLARRMEKQFDEDLKDCVQITKESLKQRNVAEKLLHWAAYHISRLVYSSIK